MEKCNELTRLPFKGLSELIENVIMNRSNCSDWYRLSDGHHIVLCVRLEVRHYAIPALPWPA